MPAISNSYINIHSHRKIQIPDEFAIINLTDKEIRILEIDNNSFFSIGLHPYNIKPSKVDKYLQTVLKYANHPLVLAIGEIGIDRSISVPVDIQKDVFEDQLRIAELVKKPVIIHCVKAYSDLLFLRNETKSSVPWIIHGFNANEKIANELISLGCYLSFGSFLMKDHSIAIKTFPLVPDDKYFLETDEESLTIDKIYKVASSLRKITMSELKQQMFINFSSIFSIV